MDLALNRLSPVPFLRGRMAAIALIIGPVFAMAALGFAAGKIGWLDEQASQGLSRFVFRLAIPMMLFRLMAKLEIEGFAWRGMGAYYVTALLVFVLAALLHERVFRLPVAEAGALAMGAAFSNNVLLGLPIAIKVYGEDGATPLLLIISCHTALLFGFGSLWIESRRPKVQGGPLLRQIARELSHNPLIIGLGCGALYQLTGWPLPTLVDEVTRMFGEAGVPTALFTMGLSLCQFQLKGNRRQALLTLLLKLCFFPVAMYVVGRWVFGLTHEWLELTVLASSMPSGINAYLFAQTYQTKEATVAATVLASTALSLFSISLILWLHI